MPPIVLNNFDPLCRQGKLSLVSHRANIWMHLYIDPNFWLALSTHSLHIKTWVVINSIISHLKLITLTPISCFFYVSVSLSITLTKLSTITWSRSLEFIFNSSLSYSSNILIQILVINFTSVFLLVSCFITPWIWDSLSPRTMYWEDGYVLPKNRYDHWAELTPHFFLDWILPSHSQNILFDILSKDFSLASKLDSQI